MYLFTYATPGVRRRCSAACHALEIPFVWDNLDAQGAAMFVGEVDDGLRALARQMGDAWVAFATDGAPAAPGPARVAPLRRRPAGHDAVRRGHGAEVVDDPGRAERELWRASTALSADARLVPCVSGWSGERSSRALTGCCSCRTGAATARVDWSPPGGVIDEGETCSTGSTREVAEETGPGRRRGGPGPVYEIEAEAPDLGLALRVEVHLARRGRAATCASTTPTASWSTPASRPPAAAATCSPAASEWVREPLAEWLTERWAGRRTFRYHVDGADRRQPPSSTRIERP